MQEHLTKWKEAEELVRISMKAFPSDWELIRTKPYKYAEEIEKRRQKAKLTKVRAKKWTIRFLLS